MVEAAKVKASIDDSLHWMLSPDWSGLDGLVRCLVPLVMFDVYNGDLVQGMGLSGCEDEEANEHFVEKLLQRYNSLAKGGIAVSDTIGSIYTACPDGEPHLFC